MSNQIEIDFAKLGPPVYIGRDRGENEREKYNLDEIDKSNTCVNVIIPEDTYSINSSFFLGLFGKSILNAGSRDNFLNKYRFKAPTVFEEAIEKFIDRALFEKNILLKDK